MDGTCRTHGRNEKWMQHWETGGKRTWCRRWGCYIVKIRTGLIWLRRGSSGMFFTTSVKLWWHYCPVGRRHVVKYFIIFDWFTWSGAGGQEWYRVIFLMCLSTTTWRLEAAASRCGGSLRIYCVICCARPTKGDPPAWGLGEGLTSYRKRTIVKCHTGPRTWTDSLERVSSGSGSSDHCGLLWTR